MNKFLIIGKNYFTNELKSILDQYWFKLIIKSNVKKKI